MSENGASNEKNQTELGRQTSGHACQRTSRSRGKLRNCAHYTLYVRDLKISNFKKLCFAAGLQFGWRGGGPSEHGVHLQRRGDGSHWQGNNLRRNGKKQEGRQEGMRHGNPHESLQLHPPRYT